MKYNAEGVPIIDIELPDAEATPGGLAMMFADQAPDGDIWVPGLQGPAGAQGAAGVTGDAGPALFFLADQGEKGDWGPPGAQGEAGATGATGPTGDAGPALYFTMACDWDLPIVPGAPEALNLFGTPHLWRAINSFRTLRIVDTAGTEYGEFSHDGTDLQLQLNDASVLAIGVVGGATDAALDVFGDSIYIEGVDPTNNVGVYVYVPPTHDTNKLAYCGVDNDESDAFIQMGAHGSTATAPFASMSRIQFNDATTSGWFLTGLASGGNRRWVKAHRPVATKYFDIQDATHLRIFDDAETDSADIYHDGTSLQTDLTLTLNWEVNFTLAGGGQLQLYSGEGYSIGGVGDAFSGWWGQANDPDGVGYVGTENTDSGAFVELDAYGTTDANFPSAGTLSFNTNVGRDGFYMRDQGNRRFAHLSRPASTKFFDIQDATQLRIFDDAETDFVAISHDGTDVNIACTNTADVNLTGARFALNSNVLTTGILASYSIDGVTPSIQASSTGLSVGSMLALRANTSNQGGQLFLARIPSNTPTDVTAVVDNDELGRFGFGATDGTDLRSGVRLIALAKETWSATAHGSEFFIQTATTASTSFVSRAMFSDTEIDLTSVLLDLNGNLDLDGTTHTLDGTDITIDAATTLLLAGGSAAVTLAGTEIDLTATDLDLNFTAADLSCMLTVPVVSSPYAPGSFTIATERYAHMVGHLKLTTTQRVTIAGTGRLRIS